MAGWQRWGEGVVCGAIQIKINNVCCLIGACNKCCFPNRCICKINNEGSFYVCLCRMPAASVGVEQGQTETPKPTIDMIAGQRVGLVVGPIAGQASALSC